MIEEALEVIYEKVGGTGLGHFVWCPVPHHEEVPRILEVERERADKHHATKFEIVQMNSGHFKAKQKLPIKALSLHDTEELLISKAKKRPCIVVACNNTTFKDAASIAELKGRKHLQDNSMILAPIVGIETMDNPRGFPPKMVARIRAFLYNQFFYLPKTCPKTKISFEKDGIIRLDRLFPASLNRGITPMDMKLANEPLALLMAQLRERFGAPSDSNLTTIREILFESLPEDCRPK
jgi:hypothetical protein